MWLMILLALLKAKNSVVFPTAASYFIWKALRGPGKSCLYLAKSDREQRLIWSLLTVIPPDSVQVLQSDRRFLLCQSIIQCLSKLIQRIEREREENSDNLQITPFASLRIFLRLRLHHENVQMPFYVKFQLKRLNIWKLYFLVDMWMAESLLVPRTDLINFQTIKKNRPKKSPWRDTRTFNQNNTSDKN